jgi:hypothetical protein
MVGSGSKVTVSVKLLNETTGAVTYPVTASIGAVKCANVTFANGAKTATATCEVDPGCEIGAYKLTVTSPSGASKTSIEYHVVSPLLLQQQSSHCVTECHHLVTLLAGSHWFNSSVQMIK